FRNGKLYMGKLRDCLELSKTFVMIDKTASPCYKSLPVKEGYRTAVYNEFLGDGIVLPEYKTLMRPDERPENLVVVTEPYWMQFEIGGEQWELNVERGAVINGASVPMIVEYGDLKRWGQHVEDMFMFHDVQTATNALPFEVGNAVAVGILRWVGLTSDQALWYYNLGINSRKGKRIYKASGAKDHHISQFSSIKRIK
ncbi:MAG: hypothetical protein ACTSRU_20695, partial [Candidatus Hodarchaeales archaeon]